MRNIDLNGDMGESLPGKIIGDDAAIMPWITSANIACGFHGGSPEMMEQTIKLAMAQGVAVGAHPSFPDIEGFGRREMEMEPAQIFSMVLYQVGAMKTFTNWLGIPLHHVKPHGALYNMAAVRPVYAEAIVAAVKQVDPDVFLYGLSGSALIDAAEKAGLASCHEVFADRRYMPNGTLAPRSMPGAVIQHEQEAFAQVLSMVKDERVMSISGEWIRLKADTICIHGDHAGAALFAKGLRQLLEKEGHQVRAH
jgi:UPF0271 protein